MALASITIVNKTGVAWSVVNYNTVHGSWSEEPADLPAGEDAQVQFGLTDPHSTFGTDGYVEYASADEGDSKAVAFIVFKSPWTNINLIEANVSGDSYEAQSEYNPNGDLDGTITFTLKQS